MLDGIFKAFFVFVFISGTLAIALGVTLKLHLAEKTIESTHRIDPEKRLVIIDNNVDTIFIYREGEK
jgi:hypothetical protein